jgi:cell wall-associated NlpC family hydrolase
LLLAGCVTAPRSQDHKSASEIPDLKMGGLIAAEALALVGRPYRYGGSDLTGFDCSGLVYFVHAAHGIATPRTTLEQYRAARPVPANELAVGDLLFFRIDGKSVAHVAIYTGDGRFVHAPETGRPVELRPLDDAYFQPRLLRFGRFY